MDLYEHNELLTVQCQVLLLDTSRMVFYSYQ